VRNSDMFSQLTPRNTKTAGLLPRPERQEKKVIRLKTAHRISIETTKAENATVLIRHQYTSSAYFEARVSEWSAPTKNGRVTVGIFYDFLRNQISGSDAFKL